MTTCAKRFGVEGVGSGVPQSRSIRVHAAGAGLSVVRLWLHPLMLAPHAVRMEPYNGAFVIPVILNNAEWKVHRRQRLRNVSIPADVAAKLKQLGALTHADFLDRSCT